jgi:D-aminopeptidase
MSYSDIIDNRRSFLKDEINSVLKATEEAKFAVGYLFLSGFNEVIGNISHLMFLKRDRTFVRFTSGFQNFASDDKF